MSRLSSLVSRLSLWISIGAACGASGCGGDVTTGSSGGGAGGTTSGSGGTGGGTTAPGVFGDWHPGWVVSWPTTLADRAIGKLGGGGATVVGYFSGTITFPGKQATSASVNDAAGYVVRIDPSGQIAWVDILASTQSVYAFAVDVDASGRVLAGGVFTGSMTIGADTLNSQGVYNGFVALLDTDGSPVWARTIGSAAGGADVTSAGFAPDGSVLISGQFDGDLDIDGAVLPGAGGGDIYAAKLSGADGSRVWSRGFGGTDVEFVFDADVDPAGDLLLSGVYAGGLDFGVGTLPEAPPDGVGYLVKVSGADGTPTFARAIGAALGYAAAAPDGFYFAGTMNGAADFGGGELDTMADVPIVAAYGPTGDLLWTQLHGDTAIKSSAGALPSASSAGLGMAWGIEGSIDFGGGSVASAGKQDLFVTAFPADGSPPRTTHFGSPTGETPYSFSLGADGGALVVGDFMGPLDFGPTDAGSGAITTQTGTDTFVLFLAPN